MKLSIKNIIIIFLIAMLGAGIGTFAVLQVNDQFSYLPGSKASNNEIVINQTQYQTKEKNDYTVAIDKAYNTVVEVATTKKNEAYNYFYFSNEPTYSTALGSGVIISEDGYIVTNEHVIDGAADEQAIKVKLFNGEEYVAKLIGFDKRSDIAVLKILEDGLQFSNFADSSQIQMGEDVIAIGNPLGLGISCSNGIISALEKEIYINNVYMTVMQTNAAVNSGNSGGGLFDIQGNLVGIVNAKKMSSIDSSVEGMGYAIPSNTVINIVNEIIENGYVKNRASLGIKVYTGNSYYTSKGILVTEVIEFGGAYEAGIKAEDVIIGINDVEINSYADLSKFLDSKNVGDIVEVKVLRNDVEMKFNVVLHQAAAN